MTVQEISEIQAAVAGFMTKSMNSEVVRVKDFVNSLYPDEKDRQMRENVMQRYIILHQVMKDDVAHFHFRKKNGELRSAFGTRCSEIIQQCEQTQQQAPAKERSVKGDCVCYFDIEKQAWRSFNVTSLVQVNTNYTL